MRSWQQTDSVSYAGRVILVPDSLVYNSSFTGAEIDAAIGKAKDDVWAGKSISATLTAAGWTDSSQTVQDAAFLSSGYLYLVKADGASAEAYAAAGITPQDVTVDGEMTFTAKTTPTGDLTLSVIRFMEG